MELVHADIFFFISSIALTIIAVLAAIALYYVIWILREIKAMIENVKGVGESVERWFNFASPKVHRKKGKVE